MLGDVPDGQLYGRGLVAELRFRNRIECLCEQSLLAERAILEHRGDGVHRRAGGRLRGNSCHRQGERQKRDM